MQIKISGLDGLPAAAGRVLAIAQKRCVFLFYGEMGAGKTTLIKELCKQLGVQDTVSSPTFSIVNEYSAKAGLIYHFDFYRIKSETEALDLGYEDYVYSGEICFIEWPEKISSLIPEQHVEVRLELLSENERLINARVL